jgi:hypothetical protein
MITTKTPKHQEKTAARKTKGRWLSDFIGPGALVMHLSGLEIPLPGILNECTHLCEFRPAEANWRA